jgi:hypothetical protein
MAITSSFPRCSLAWSLSLSGRQQSIFCFDEVAKLRAQSLVVSFRGLGEGDHADDLLPQTRRNLRL